ncbi:MAG TPA: DUF3098 domain-containing protein [Saprospiraceae bacterium]|nr:DUF3098 domain-containing protein [Lewinellaceae bacterium]HQU58752.1 DUF3098 domain-containing protein [Saprospiraceae bacterium]
MSQNRPPKKKVVVTTQKKSEPVAPSRRRAADIGSRSVELEFGRQNYILMGVGVALIVLGMFLMAGGDMPDRQTWDPELIYSTRRTLIAPMVILAGLIVEIVAIFKKA